MARPIKSYLYWITPVSEPTSGVVKAIVDFLANPTGVEFDLDGQAYLASEFEWHPKKAMLTGTVFKIRTNGLPVAVKGTGTHDLPLSDDENLGEPMCFAFWPEKGGAIVQYAHTGPRHSVMQPMLSKIGYPHPMNVEPVLREDMLQELKSKRFFRAFEFSLRDPKGIAALRDQGGAVGAALKGLQDLGGVNVRMEVTMGHEKGEGLIPNAVQSTARYLARVNAETPDGKDPVTTLKVWGAETDDMKSAELDLLRAREPIILTIDEDGRSLDRSDCQRKLLAALDERRQKLLLQFEA